MPLFLLWFLILFVSLLLFLFTFRARIGGNKLAFRLMRDEICQKKVTVVALDGNSTTTSINGIMTLLSGVERGLINSSPPSAKNKNYRAMVELVILKKLRKKSRKIKKALRM